MFVYVEYEANLKTAVVEHTQVQAADSKKGFFNPLDADDFDPSETYRVHSYHGDNFDCEYLNAKIIHMTETLEEMVSYRAKRPRMSVIQEEADSQRLKERTSRPPARRQDRDHAKRAQRQQLIERALRDYETEPAPANVLKTLERKLQAMEEQLSRARLDIQGQSSPSGTGSSDSVPKSAYTVLKTKYEALRRDIEELQARNSDLEKSLKSQISQDEGSPIDTTGCKASESTAPALTSAAEESNGHMSETEDHAQSDAHSEGHMSETEDLSQSDAHSEGHMSETEDHTQADAHSEEGSPANTARNDVTVSAVPAPTSAQESNGHTSDAEDCAQSDDAQPEAEPELDETANSGQPESVGDMYKQEADEDELEIGTIGKDGKLYAGCGYWFTKKEWGKLFGATTDGTFCGRAASLFWTEEELAERSVTGRISNAAAARGFAVQRQPLSPEKLSALKDLFQVYIGEDAFAARRLKNVRTHLSTYLCYMRRKSSSQS